MKKAAAAAGTAIVLAVLLVGTAMRSSAPTLADKPELCLDQMFQAMKAGDVSAYLNCFAGELRERLGREAREQGDAKFAAYLKDSVAPVTGRTVLHDRSERTGDDAARLVVDRTYAPPRMWEYQAFRLRRERGAWKIVAIDPAESHEPLVPYGTPAVPTPEKSESEN